MPILNDSLGRWRMIERKDVCSTCGCKVTFTVTPHTPLNLPDGIDAQRTILARGSTVGLTCGCYAKLHRQIAHIQDAMR